MNIANNFVWISRYRKDLQRVWHPGGEVQGGYFANYLHYFLLFHYFYYSTILHSDALLMTTALGVAGRHIGVGAYLYVGVVTPKYKQK